MAVLTRKPRPSRQVQPTVAASRMSVREAEAPDRGEQYLAREAPEARPAEAPDAGEARRHAEPDEFYTHGRSQS